MKKGKIKYTFIEKGEAHYCELNFKYIPPLSYDVLKSYSSYVKRNPFPVNYEFEEEINEDMNRLITKVKQELCLE